MKPILFALLVLLFALPAAAQVDAKLNAGSALTLGLGVAAEFPLGAQSALSLGLGYSSLGLTVKENDYTYRNLRLVPEYRYYFAPRDGMDRFFAGGYGKVGRLVGVDKSNDQRVDAIRAVLGVMAGHKWVTPGGFLFELNAGMGRALTFGGGDGDALYARAISTLTSFDLRLGILVGWRIGG